MRITIKILIPAITSFVMGFIIYVAGIESNNGGVLHVISPDNIGNIPFYILVVSIIIITFLTLQLLKYDISDKQLKINPILLLSIAVCFATVVVLLILGNVSATIVAITSTLILLISTYIYRQNKTNKDHSRTIKTIELIFVTLTMLIMFHFMGVYTVFAGNPTFDPYAESISFNTWYNVHHTSAVVDSIYNTYLAQPFGTDGLTEQYGHYSLFFIWPLSITGCNSLVIHIIFGILSAICILLAYYISKNIIKNWIPRLLFIIVCMISFTLEVSNNVYWQVTPIRLIGPLVMLCYCTFITKHDIASKYCYLVGFFISALSVLWNFESGAVVCLGWSMFCSYKVIQKNGLNVQGLLAIVIITIGTIALSIIFTYLVVNGYNFIISDLSFENSISLKSLFGWSTNDEYISILQWPLKWKNISFFLIFAFTLLFMLAIKELFMPNNNMTEQYGAVFIALSIIGLGLATYYFNRSGAGIRITELFLGLTLCILIDRLSRIIKDGTHKPTVLTFVSVFATTMCILILFNVASVDTEDCIEKISDRESCGFYDRESYESEINKIKETVDSGTYGAGMGVSEIFMDLGWTNRSTNFDPKYREDLNVHDKVFIYNDLKDVLNSDFICIKEFNMNGVKYSYYVKEGA